MVPVMKQNRSANAQKNQPNKQIIIQKTTLKITSNRILRIQLPNIQPC
jgi:hypothetical protein